MNNKVGNRVIVFRRSLNTSSMPRSPSAAVFRSGAKRAQGMIVFAIAVLALGLGQVHEPADALAGALAPVEYPNRRDAATQVVQFNVERATNDRVAQTASTPGTSTAPAAPQRTGPPVVESALATMCQTLQSAARANDLPLVFLTRLIWQESRFRAHAVSPAGALGVAQFMPNTAAWVGLADPFDIAVAIDKSAELLRNLKDQFGNLGLAAAAYNAGPKRVRDWLAKRRSLPTETRAYVQIVTGHGVDLWTALQPGQGPVVRDTVPCPQQVKLLAATPENIMLVDKETSVSLLKSTWGVQLLGNASQPAVLAAYRQLQMRYRTILGNRPPLVIRSKVGRGGDWYRVRIAANSLLEAERLCSSLRAMGGNCLVQRN
jgi:hypothetical protein